MDRSTKKYSDRLFVILNKDRWNAICDVVKQTSFALIKKGSTVISIEFHSPIKFIDVLFSIIYHKSFPIIHRSSGVYLLRPILFPYSNRSYALYQCSIAINCILLQIILRIRFPNKKKYLWIIFPQLQWLNRYFILSYKIIYDIIDYFTSPSEIEAQNLELSKRKLLQSSDFIFSNSYTLKKLYQQYTRIPIHVVPQGFRLDDYKRQKCRSMLLRTKKPIIGFIGGINERLDSELLLRLIPNHPEWQFVFVGAFDHDMNVCNSKFYHLDNMIRIQSNITLLSRQNPRKLASIVQQFTICMIPYDVSQDFNRYCYPMKLFEYFYMGKPVISTPIEELKRFSKYVRIGRTAEEWEKHIQSLLAKPWSDKYRKEEKRRALANSWEKKIGIICNIIYSSHKNNHN